MVKSNQFQEARACLDEALNLEDENYSQGELDDESMKLLSFCHLKLGQSDQALLTMVSEGEIYDIDTLVSLLDDCYRIHKDYQQALEWGQLILDWNLFQEDEEHEEYLPDIYLIMIYSNARQKNEDQIQVYINKLVQTKSSEEMVPYEIMAEELIQVKCYSIALRFLETYASFSRAKSNLHGLQNLMGCCYVGLRSYDKAATCFQKSFNVHHWIVPYTNMIRCYIQLGKYGKAQQIFDEIITFDPYYSWTYYQSALYYIKMKDEDRAVELLKKSISLGFAKNEILNDPDYHHLAEKLN
ncbi:tetratricopeptide repeat protein [Flagellimonas sp. 2504JD1-5]